MSWRTSDISSSSFRSFDSLLIALLSDNTSAGLRADLELLSRRSLSNARLSLSDNSFACFSNFNSSGKRVEKLIDLTAVLNWSSSSIPSLYIFSTVAVISPTQFECVSVI